MEGVGILFWMPIIVKYGRRPVYIGCYGAYCACCAWAGVAKSYGSELAARIFLGFFSSAGLSVAPLTIADLFFLHERGAIMAWYTTALNSGAALGNVITGLITIHHDWRTAYYVSTALIGFCFVLMVFTMPETSFNRATSDTSIQFNSGPNEKSSVSLSEEKGEDLSRIQTYQLRRPTGNKKSYVQELALFNGTFSSEPLLKIFIRPFGVILLPPVFWATMVTSVAVGFVVAVNTNIGGAFQVAYHFKTWQVGLVYISAMIGALLGIFWGGIFSDWVANLFTKRNGGVREPEMRLPAFMVPLVCLTLGLALYGVGVQKEMHWMVPTFALGLCEYIRKGGAAHDANRRVVTFAACICMNIAMVYTIDAYRPIAAECIVAILGFKGLSFSLPLPLVLQQARYFPSFSTLNIIALWRQSNTVPSTA